MRYRTLEIRWHDSKPIASCDFQPVAFKKARPHGAGGGSNADAAAWAGQTYRLATAGEDNHVRVWMVYPNIRPKGMEGNAVVDAEKDENDAKGDKKHDAKEKPKIPAARVEYLATLSRHSAAVNVVRWSPNGELIASAGDDGMIIIWAPSATPQTSTYGSDLSAEDLQHEKEYWKPRTTFRCTTMQVYDLAWSPTGEFVLAGSTDNAARVFAAADGKPLFETAEHAHFVQGVAWDPLNEFVATQSADRAMHVYRIGASGGKSTFEAHAVGRNTRLPVGHARTHSASVSLSGRKSRTPSVHRERDRSVDISMRERSISIDTPRSISGSAEPGVHIHTPGTRPLALGLDTHALAHGHAHPQPPTPQQEWSRPRMMRSDSVASDVESEVELPAFGGGSAFWNEMGGPLTPGSSASGSAFPGLGIATPGFSATSVGTPAVSAASAGAGAAAAGASSAMFPPPAGSSRRSSFSGSNAPSSPSGFSAVSGFSRAYGRSPSPMPALPAIRTPPSASAGWAGRYEDRERSSRHEDRGRHVNDERPSSKHDERAGDRPERGRYGTNEGERRYTDGAKMYGDEGFSNFFRRLAFSPDGALLLTPAGTFEDPGVGVAGWDGAGIAGESATDGKDGKLVDEMAARGRKARPVISTGGGASTSAATEQPPASASSVYIYSRANFARPPVAQLPGHKKASVAVRFCPVLFELRSGVGGGGAAGSSRGGDAEPKMGLGSATGEEGTQQRDVEESMEVDLVGPLAGPVSSSSSSSAMGIAAPAPQHASFNVLASPALSPADRRPPTPAASKPSTPAPGHASTSALSATPPGTGSVFALPYRMLYAVVTMDTVAIYDTQQAGPVCLLTKLHYDEFTDLTWSPDGQCLMLSSRDGYCTLVTFDEILPTHHTQQAALQLQQIAAHHSVPISYAPSGSGSQQSRKRPLEPLTPAASVDGDREHHHALPASSSAASIPASISGTNISSLDTEATVDGAAGEDGERADGPPKKKRRVALTRVGDL